MQAIGHLRERVAKIQTVSHPIVDALEFSTDGRGHLFPDQGNARGNRMSGPEAADHRVESFRKLSRELPHPDNTRPGENEERQRDAEPKTGGKADRRTFEHAV